MTEHHALILLFCCLVVINWTAAFILLRLAVRRPQIKALTERALLAVLIAIVTSLTLMGESLPEATGFETLARIAMVAISLYPLWWLWSYYSGRF